MKKLTIFLVLIMIMLCGCSSVKTKELEKAVVSELKSFDKIVIERYEDNLLIYVDKNGDIYCEHNGNIRELTFEQLGLYFFKKARE